MFMRIVWRNFTAKPVPPLLTVAIVALAFGMTVTMLQLFRGLQQGLTRATETFDLIVGAKGSPIQLVLNTLFLQEAPIGNIEGTLVKELQNEPGVKSVIPLGFGDNYQGRRIIGATPELFELTRPGGSPWLRPAEGKIFNGPFEAVIGAEAAEGLQLQIGDTFTSVHGVLDYEQGEHHHRHPYRVVGILEEVGGPYDQAILVDLESIWDIHGADDVPPVYAESKRNEFEMQGEEHDHEEDHTLNYGDDHGHAHGVTVILVKPDGYADAMRLYRQFQNESRAQLIFPAQVIVRFFALMGQGEDVLKWIGYLMMGMTLFTVGLTLYGAAYRRGREQAVLRVIGARARDVFALILLEGALTVSIGLLAGLFIGHGLFETIAGFLQQQTAIAIVAGAIGEELILVLGTLGLGLAASTVPAGIAYRFDLAANL